jgi:hypothetical protein
MICADPRCSLVSTGPNTAPGRIVVNVVERPLAFMKSQAARSARIFEIR